MRCFCGKKIGVSALRNKKQIQSIWYRTRFTKILVPKTLNIFSNSSQNFFSKDKKKIILGTTLKRIKIFQKFATYVLTNVFLWHKFLNCKISFYLLANDSKANATGISGFVDI